MQIEVQKKQTYKIISTI